MEEKDLEILKMALKLGRVAVYEMFDMLDYCQDIRNDFYMMIERLSEKVGADMRDIY